MELAICPQTLGGLVGGDGGTEAIMTFCAGYGVKTFDFGIRSRPGTCLTYADDWMDRAKKFAENTSALGYRFCQSHAPYSRFLYENIEYYREMTRRSIEIAAILGAPCIVIHPELRDFRTQDYDHGAAFARAKEFYLPFAELASRLGVRLAVENLFDFKRRWNYGATVEEQIEFIEALGGSDTVGACWDFGHAHVMYGDEDSEKLRQLGSRVICTHVHDNSQAKDLHLPPYLGEIDWDRQMKALADTGYRGELNLEIKVAKLPPELKTDYLDFIFRGGKRLTEIFESYINKSNKEETV